jgi:hypothetical protein
MKTQNDAGEAKSAKRVLAQVKRDVTRIAKKVKQTAALPPAEQERVIEGILPTSGPEPPTRSESYYRKVQELLAGKLSPLAADKYLWHVRYENQFIGKTINDFRWAVLGLVQDAEEGRLSYGDAKSRRFWLEMFLVTDCPKGRTLIDYEVLDLATGCILEKHYGKAVVDRALELNIPPCKVVAMDRQRTRGTAHLKGKTT